MEDIFIYCRFIMFSLANLNKIAKQANKKEKNNSRKQNPCLINQKLEKAYEEKSSIKSSTDAKEEKTSINTLNNLSILDKTVPDRENIIKGGSEIINKIGKHKNKCIVIHKPLKKKATKKNLQRWLHRFHENLTQKNEIKTRPIIKPLNKEKLKEKDIIQTKDSNFALKSLEFYKKKQKTKSSSMNSKSNSNKTPREIVESASSLQIDQDSSTKSDLDLEIAEFYHSLNDLPNPDNGDEVQIIEGFSSSESKNINTNVTSYLPDANVCLASKLTSDGNLYLALHQNERICIDGIYYLKLIFGSVSVLGYKFKEGEEQAIFSPSTHAALAINILSGDPIKELNKKDLEKYGIPFGFLKGIKRKKGQNVAIVQLRSYTSPAIKLIQEIFLHKEENYFRDDIWKEALGIHINNSSDDYKSLNEPPEWISFMDYFQSSMAGRKDWRVILTGGKSVGKSTFLKFFINHVLSSSDLTEVACLDLDPGQPEFSFGTCLSLTRVIAPLLGPPFSHSEKEYFSFQEAIVYGDKSVEPGLREYIEVLATLVSTYHHFEEPVPLVVNTMGYTRSCGVDIICDIIRILRPTHLVSIKSSDRSVNFEFEIKDYNISSMNRGIATTPGEDLKYDFIEFHSKSSNNSRKSKSLREMRFYSYLSQMWDGNVKPAPQNCKPAIKIDWRHIGIYIPGTFVPQTHILQAINASLVALCKINPNYLERADCQLPFQIQGGPTWFRYNKLIGWGIVKGIDPTTKEIHILTPLSQEVVYSQVNVLSVTGCALPNYFFQLFSPGIGPYRNLCDWDEV